MDAKFEYLLRQGDNALILSQQLSQLCGKGPALEEDMALTNVALDLLGQTRMWLTYAGELEGKGRDEDRRESHAEEDGITQATAHRTQGRGGWKIDRQSRHRRTLAEMSRMRAYAYPLINRNNQFSARSRNRRALKT